MSATTTASSGKPTAKQEAPSLSSLRPPPEDTTLHPLVNEQMTKDILLLCLAWRFINALCMKTFFQPDEYFQSLEPAWQMAFGSDSGAWITWEWQHQLRSSLHPALFAIAYYALEKPMKYLEFFPQFRAMILSVLPNVVQSLFAAAGDYYTWRLAKKIYGTESNASWAALLMTILSPWQWFCSTRTFSNSLETTLTIAALYYWPWDMTIDLVANKSSSSLSSVDKGEQKSNAKSNAVFQSAEAVTNLRISFLLSATACILRPTNGLIWFSILMPTITRLLPNQNSSPASRPTLNDYLILVREAIICGSLVLAISAFSDYKYFGEWTFPPYQWLNFNVSQDLAVFYGRNDWHYFVSQGLPLLLTTYLPFAVVGIYQAISSDALTTEPKASIRFLFATTIFTTIFTLSLISHKEVRFIYPLLPILHILAAPTIASFFHTTSTITTFPPPFPSTPRTETVIVTHRHILLSLLLLTNMGIGGYTTYYHQSGIISVTKYLRSEYERLALTTRGVPLSSSINLNLDALLPETNIDPASFKISNFEEGETFAAFLMPCHSTPWRSQLVYPGLKAWALTCEPPIHLKKNTKERMEYRDEADRFYDDPVRFLKEEVNTKEKPWPRYVVGFEGIEGVLKSYYEEEMKGFVVREKWRGFNSHWHDDSRRKGDVVVWEFVDGSKA